MMSKPQVVSAFGGVLPNNGRRKLRYVWMSGRLGHAYKGLFIVVKWNIVNCSLDLPSDLTYEPQDCQTSAIAEMSINVDFAWNANLPLAVGRDSLRSTQTLAVDLTRV
jgi:hypothetical protein